MRHSEFTLIKFFVKVKKKTLCKTYILAYEKKKKWRLYKTTKFVNVCIFMEGGKKTRVKMLWGVGLLTYLRQVLHIYFGKYLSSLT